jgi:uncharacterized membrane-anchored protein
VWPSPKEGTTVSTSVSALFYFLALLRFVRAAFAVTSRRSSFASRINLIALGLAFWVFVPFFNTFKRVIS